MTVQAYILVQTDVGRSAAVATAISALPGVTAADEVLGPYEVVVHVDVADSTELKSRLLPRLRAVPGITRTLTCEVVQP
ncbi:MAG: transcriptional regulator, AsnC family [Frankiales bacterium]|nr:transcriptional regulator, AsnC family [Frankiales bacterium]